MYYGKNSYKLDQVHFDRIIKNKDPKSYTYLFEKYFEIVQYHLYSRFSKVRHSVLKDIAIETVEDWILDIQSINNVKIIGNYLCRRAGSGVMKILRYNGVTRPTQLSEFKIDDGYSVSKFLDLLLYRNQFGNGYDNDIAKLTFSLKSKADKHIGNLSDRDYKIITLYLDGVTKKVFNDTIGIGVNYSESIKIALTHLKESIDGNKRRIGTSKKQHRIFKEQQDSYKNTTVSFKHPDAMDMYYNKEMSIKEIADSLSENYDVVKVRIKRDRDLMTKG